jgi:hypothetical protein
MADWDRSRKWTVHQSFETRRQLTLVVAGQLTAEQLVTLRQMVPSLPWGDGSKLGALANAEGRIQLGVLRLEEARQLQEALASAGLSVEAEDVRHASYLFVDEADSSALIVDDLAEARRIALEMIAAGAPVVRFDGE